MQPVVKIVVTIRNREGANELTSAANGRSVLDFGIIDVGLWVVGSNNVSLGKWFPEASAANESTCSLAQWLSRGMVGATDRKR